MALEDTFGSVDPHEVVDDLTRQALPELGPGPVDSHDVIDRLLRKVMGRRRQPSDINFQAPAEEPEDKGAPDFSKQGTPVDQLPDFSQDGVPIDQLPENSDIGAGLTTGRMPDKGLGVVGGAAAFGKGIPAGAIEGTGAALQGAGVATSNMPGSPDLMMSGGAPMPPEFYKDAVNPAPASVKNNPLYQAGSAVKQFGDNIAPMSEAEKASIPGRVGRGIGGVLPAIAAGVALGPEAGIGVGAAMGGAQAAGDTFDAAIKKGASEDQASKAAGWSGLVGAALGGLPIGAVLKPVRIAAPGMLGKAAGYLAEAGKDGVVFASVGEAQEFAASKIAQEYYDKDAGYIKDFDARRVIASLLTGGIIGAGGHFMRQRAERAVGMPPGAEPAPPGSRLGGGSPPPSGGPEPTGSPGPAPGPDTSGASEPGAGPGTSTGGGARGGAQSGAGPSRPAPGADFKMDPLTRTKMEKVYRAFRMSGDPTSMSDADLFNAVNEHVNSGSGARPESAEDIAARKATETERTEREALKRRGWTDAHINAMTPEQRRKYFQDAMAGGQARPPEESTQPRATEAQPEPGEAPKAPKVGGEDNATTMSEAGQAGQQPDTSAVSGGTRTEPIKATTADDVLAASSIVAEPKSDAQAKAENYQHGHIEIDHLGLTGAHSISIETGVGQERKGTSSDGTEWKVNLPVAYGRIKGTKGADGQPLDIFVGPQPTSAHVFIIDQHHDAGGFDEHKIMAGFPNPRAALRAYGESYSDGGGNRIGHVVALTPDEFKGWLKSDTTQPFKKSSTPSEQPAATTVEGDTASAGGPEGGKIVDKNGRPLAIGDRVKATNMGGQTYEATIKSFHTYQGKQQAEIATDVEGKGRNARSFSARPNVEDIEKIVEGEVTGPHRVERAEVTQEHHDQIEAVLGQDYDRVLPVDAHRAAEILSEQPGITPELAFQHAVIENAITQGYLTFDQAEQAYGPQVEQLLLSGPEGSSGGGAPAESGSAAPEQERAAGTEETGVVPRGGEGRGEGEHARPAGEEAENRKQHDTGRGQPDTGRKAGGEAADEGAGRTEVPDLSNLGPVERYNAIQAEANRRWPPRVETKTVGKGKNKKTETNRYVEHEHIAFTNGAQGYDWNMAMPINATKEGMAEAYNDGREWAVAAGLIPSSKVQAADSEETINVSMSREGPWDFNDTWPSPDPDLLAALEKEGRSPFSGAPDVEQVAGMLDETMNSLMGDFSTMKAAGTLLQGARSGKIKPPNKQKPEQWMKALKGDIATAAESVKGTSDAIADVFGKKAASAMLGEARRRIAQEDRGREVIAEAENNRLEKQREEAETTAEPEVNKIEDAGEKIGGARKDAWIGRGLTEGDLEGMTGAELDKFITKHNVWKKPDYVAAIADGVEPLAAALIKRVYDRISVNPNNGRHSNFDLPELRRLYIKTLTDFRDGVVDLKTAKQVRDFAHKFNYDLNDTSIVMQPGSRMSPFYISGKDERAAQRAVDEGWPQAPAWTRLFIVREDKVYERGDDGKIKRGTDGVAIYNTSYFVDRKNGGRAGDIDGYDTREAAEAAAKQLYEAMPDERKTGGETPKRPHLDKVNRDGPDYRKGRNVTGEDFIKDFGFRGVEFGNWVAGDERQQAVNLAYDALHDLARVLNVNPKALSLDGTLSVAFGARGRGGNAAAHYEADRTVINLTKIQGAGTLAHEYGHALDHYLGEIDTKNPYGGKVQSLSGWDTTPKDPDGYYSQRDFLGRMLNLKPKLRAAANRLMFDLFNRWDDDETAIRKLQAEIDSRKSGLKGWVDHLASIKERMKQGGSRAGITQAEQQIELWGKKIKRLEEQMAAGNIPRRVVRSSYYEEAAKLSGSSGDYWRRPNELFARAFESFVFDKIAKEGFTSQYLVQGVEPNRFGNGFKGNPYPAGEERDRIHADFDRVVRALATGTGKHGDNTRLQGAEGEPEPVATVEKVKRPVSQPSMVDEAKAVEQSSVSLTDAFARRFMDGQGFANILQARKFAKEHSGVDDPKAVEEALEFGVVKAARANIEASDTPQDAYKSLVSLYASQPRLGTRTSTSMRDQAYSTPVPLAYVASRLAGIDKTTTVYEPTAGNGALLIAANPAKVRANELNPERRANLEQQGYYRVTNYDAAGKPDIIDGTVDVVIANPPFGVVKEGDSSKRFDMKDLQPGYQTGEIDHVIALKALAVMRDGGRAVLILGGLNKQLTTDKARSDGYNSKAKREFYKVLYDNYNVTDHFTVDGDLYERQGAGWPVDVIVINGRGKSARALPAVDVPRIYSSWDSLGGLVNGQPDTGNAGRAEGTSRGAADRAGPGLAGRSGTDRGDAGSERPAVREPSGVREQPEAGNGPARGGRGAARPEPERGGEPAGVGEQPAAERPSSGLSVSDAFDEALDELFGPSSEEQPEAPRAAKADEEPRARRERTARETASDAGKAGFEAADKALSGLYQLFGGGKTHGAGFNFDEETYAKAKPMFKEAAGRFRDFWGDAAQLVKQMLRHMRDTLKWPREVFERMKPYIMRFMDDLAQGRIKLGEEEKPVAPRERQESKATESEGQVRYTPQSTMPGLDTLVPSNMRTSIADSLANLEERVGPIDKFVAKELGYKDEAQLADHFGAEQVDALGLAIDNIKRGKGFIIGDQTGIGKGRVNAAIIKWSIANGRVPIFVTEKPGLYADIYRDMKDIGMMDSGNKPVRMLPTNATMNLPLEEGRGLTLKTGSAKEHNALLAKMADKRAFDDNYDLVLTNYSQMQTLKGEDTARRRFLQAIAPHAVMILDESHNAGGQKKSGEKEGPADRADFARGLIEASNGVFYSSATYAKRPDVMDLYAATDMAMAVDNLDDLGEAIGRGGVPMQQAVASMLSQAGQYIRRERSFNGITYNTPSVAVDRKSYNDISNALAAIQDFSKAVAFATDRISDELKAEAGGLGADNATGDAGASSTNFTALMHNIVNQMLLAMKAAPAAKMAIEAIQRGEKPVLTVANTMESFLKDYAETLDLKPGDTIDADFSDVLMKYLKRSRMITIKKPFGKKEDTVRRELTDDELGPVGREMFARGKEMIGALNLSHLPISPIDYIKGELKKAGYETGEITGRSLGIDYSGKKPVLRTRSGAELTTKGRNETRAAFNRKPENGGHHAIIINQAGSTGISMHTSKTFNDQSKRHMFIVQPEGNIDTHMQLLGRVNRTGQVVLPEYSQLVADIPAEKRPAAVLAKKMASLNANTTASRTSAVTAKDVPDFINQYGDEVAANWAADNPELNYRLGNPIKVSEKTGKPEKADAMRKLTGRIPLRPLDGESGQEAIYQTLEDEYAALLEQLDAAGENALEAKTLDLKAKPIERTEVQGKKNNSNSPFAAPVIIEKVNVARLGKPFRPVEILNRLAKELIQPDQIQDERNVDERKLFGFFNGLDSEWSTVGKSAATIERNTVNNRLKDFNTYMRGILDEIEAPEKQKKEADRLNANKDRWTSLMARLRIGNRVTLRTVNGNLTGFVIKVEQKGEPKNPLALGSWKATVAVSDASRQITLPFSRLVDEGKADPESMLDVEVLPLRYERPEGTLKRFELMQHEAREERFIATGNILAAYDWLSHKGAIVNYTTDKGEVRQGILTARNFDLTKHATDKGRIINNPEELQAWLEKNPTETVWSKDHIIGIRRESTYSDRYIIQTEKAKKTGGVYYLDKPLTDITGDFYSRGGQMVTDIASGKLVPAIARLQSLGAQFKVKAAAPKAEKVKDEPPSGGPQPDMQGQTETPRGNPTFGAFGSPDLVVKAFKGFWTDTFQPELFSDRALMADPLFARYKSVQQQEKDALIRQSESEWNYWNKKSDAQRLAFLSRLERDRFDVDYANDTEAAMARRYRRMLDANWAEEQRWGSQASFVEDYFPHIWEKPDDWRAFAEARSAQMGPTWFQKKRSYDYIDEGLAHGLKLKYTNPIDILVHRLSSGVDMRQRMQLLYGLKDMGLAWEGRQGGPELVRHGWRMIVAPDRRQWVIAPDAQRLWQNGVEAQGFWQADHIGGSMFRGWMALKNAWIPLRLAFSAFHPLHVAGISYANNMALAWDQLVKGRDLLGALKSIGEAHYDAPIAAPGASAGAAVGAAIGSFVGEPVWGSILGSIGGSIAFGAYKRMGGADLPHLGKTARAAWSKRPSQQTPEEKALVQLMNDGGFVPQLSDQMKIGAKRQLAVAYQRVLRGEAGVSDWRKMVTASMRHSVEVLQAPIFEHWIPNLKAAAYIRQAAALLKRRPELLTAHSDRRLALRGIAKSIDNRFGEMFYGNLFWNRYVKDAGIASFLSIGWNLGFVREFGGAAMEAVTRPAGIIPPLRPGANRQTVRDATNKRAFAIAYIASSALVMGIMSMLLDDEHRFPEGMDFIFPRIGGTNPDGSPRRITNMTYLREVPMLIKHVQERGGNWLTGTGEMIYSKMLLEPFMELKNNRDYYGYNIWDENAPVYKQIWQALKHTFGDETNPMSMTGAKRAAELSGHPFPKMGEALSNPSALFDALRAKGVDMSLLGFGPAPTYVEKTGIQNRISYLYREHVVPASKPSPDDANTREKAAVRTAIMLAKRDHDSGLMTIARQQGRKLGLTAEYMNNIGKTPTDVYLFSRLPTEDQRAILNQADPDEMKRYFPHASQKTKAEYNRARYDKEHPNQL